jgi:hypothetical protein
MGCHLSSTFVVHNCNTIYRRNNEEGCTDSDLKGRRRLRWIFFVRAILLIHSHLRGHPRLDRGTQNYCGKYKKELGRMRIFR